MLRCMSDHALASGDISRASARAGEAETCLREVDATLELGFVFCVQGHIALSQGKDAQELLDGVERIIEELSLTEDSELHEGMTFLRRGQHAFEAGQPLLCGFSPEDYRAPHLEWLRKNRPEAIPPEFR